MTNVKALLLAHYTNNPGVDAHWETIGTNYREGRPAMDELLAEGKLEYRKVPSKSGKRMMNKIFATGK